MRGPPPAAQIIKAEIVLWTAGFVLLTLVINAPMLPYVLRWTGLSKGALPLRVGQCTVSSVPG
jgi:hypothetical protein